MMDAYGNYYKKIDGGGADVRSMIYAQDQEASIKPYTPLCPCYK